MLKQEIFSEFHSNNAIKYHCDENGARIYSYGKLRDAIAEVQKVIIEERLSECYVGVALPHSAALIAIISGIHLSNSAFCCLRFHCLEIDSLVTILRSVPTSYCFLCKTDGTYLLEHQGSPIIFTIEAEFTLLDDQIVLLRFDFGLSDSKIVGPKVAYCVATSGTTGAPKLVRVPSQCIVPNLVGLEKLLTLRQTDEILVSCPPTFDPFVVDVFLALRNGACLILTGNEIRLDAARLQRAVFAQDQVSVMLITPSLLRQWNDTAIREMLLSRDSSLRHLLLGGEPYPYWLKIPDESPVKVYNIYGITEVSCWASIERISSKLGNASPSLGKPLDDTIVFQLHDMETGDVLDLKNAAKPIQGNLHIGSAIRKCIVDGECAEDVLNSDSPCFRSTGDLVELQLDGKFYFMGRCDGMIKRLGVRVNLGRLEWVADQCEGVIKSCAVFNHIRHRIVLLCTASRKLQNIAVRRALETKLRLDEMPDDIIQVENLPLSEHGKIDRKKCLEQVDYYHATIAPIIIKDVFLQNIYQFLGICPQPSDGSAASKRLKFDLDCSFIDAGGTSIQALQISTSLQESAKTSIPNLIGMLIDKSVPLQKILEYLDRINQNVTSFPLQQETLNKNSDTCKLQITIKSFFNMDKCIDANPTEYYSSRTKRRIISVGSHSHKLFVVDSDTDEIVTQLALPDRIESAVSYIAGANQDELGLVGCYDGFLYCFDLWSGDMRWSFDSGGMIKCSASVVGKQSTIIFGSYAEEHNLFALDVIGKLIWRTRLGNKGILSSPLPISFSTAFVATLDGTYCCLNVTNGAVIWTGKLQSPVFADTIFMQHYKVILVAEVQGALHCLAGKCGSKLWEIPTRGNLFSSPQVRSSSGHETAEIFFGCHDKHFYCYIWTGKYSEIPVLKWKVLLQSPIYASPSIRDDLVVACSTSGWVNLICVSSGKLVGLLKLDGEVFSSPLIIDRNLIYAGCRDNKLYKLSFER